ncbi:MAG: asparagine synthase (glutamine-hydrolyzing) [Desulfobacteraceae bacterium]|nr:MAG: asparagine synthase (glutamine-hydrolyzing) [Desulfobacteraceae bacterium]
MCGIAGYIGSKRTDQEKMRACLSLMRRRGPDACAEYSFSFGSDRQICLLHSRLSIIDLDPRSNQPFRKHGKALVFNGEVYNYREIGQLLTQQGYAFETSSDTEVLLSALDAWGIDGLALCEGMWAFACFDQSDGSLMLCRDRFGEKPLYLLETPHGLYFGSEPKFIFALAGRKPRPNIRQLHRFLINGYKSLYKQPETFFEGLTELPPGCVLRMNPVGKGQVQRYWTPSSTPENAMSYAEAVEGARAALIRSMEIRLRADVPLAFCMSGGVDSNALIATARRRFGYNVHGFTIVNTDSRYEEMDLVRCAVDELGMRHTAVPLQRDGFLENLRTLVRCHDAPVYTITYYVHWLLMKRISELGYRISVSGTAADELFTGYYDHHGFYLAMVQTDPQWYARSLDHWHTHIRPIVRNPLLQDPEAFVRDPLARGHIYLDVDLFAECLHDPLREPFFENQFCDDLLRNRMLNELFHEAVPVILHEDDLNAMYFSVENRSPFLDRSIFEHCFRIPTRHLIQEGAAKAVLRDAMRGIVPDPILDNRRKVGFNAPILDLLDVHSPDVVRQMLEDSPIFDHVRRERIQSMLSGGAKTNSQSKFLFNFLSCKLFLEEFGP